MYTNLMVIDLLFYYLYRPAKKSSVEKYKKKIPISVLEACWIVLG